MSQIKTTIYHHYLELLGYKARAKGKDYHYFLGDDEVICEVYAGTNGNGVRGYVYQDMRQEQGCLNLMRNPSFFGMRDALAMVSSEASEWSKISRWCVQPWSHVLRCERWLR